MDDYWFILSTKIDYHVYQKDIIEALESCFDYYTEENYDESGCVSNSWRTIVSGFFTVQYKDELENSIVTSEKNYVECPTTSEEVEVLVKLEKIERVDGCWVATYYADAI